MSRRRVLAVIATLATVGAGALGTFHPAAASTAYTKLVFPTNPIAQPGTLGASATVPLEVQANNSNNHNVGAGAIIYLSLVELYYNGAGGSATASDATQTNVPLTTAPQAFTTDSNGQVSITYTAPASTRTTGRDVITAQDAMSSPSVTQSATYVFSPVTSYAWSPAAPIAPPGTLGAGQSRTFTVTALDGGGHGVPGAYIDLSLTSTASSPGSAVSTDYVFSTQTNPFKPIPSTPTRFASDPNGTGTLTITYTAPATLPPSGVDTITAQDHPTFTVINTTGYAFQRFNGFQSLGCGPLGGNPQTVAGSLGRIYTFWRGTDNTVWYAWYNNGWHCPGNLTGSSLTGDPHPVATGNGTVDVFWKGTDGNLWHAYELSGSGSFSAASSLGGGPLGSEPQPTSSGHGDVAVFWKGMDNDLWEGAYRPGVGWQVPIGLLSGPLNGVPHAAAYTTNSYDIFWRGTDNAIWHTWGGAGGFTGPQSIGMGPIGGDPIAIAAGSFAINLYWQGSDNGLWHAWYSGGWRGPSGYGGTVDSQPSPILFNPGQLDVFWRSGTDISHLSGGVPTALDDGPLPTSDVPSAMSWGDGHEEVFWKYTNGDLWHDWANATP